MSKKSLILSSSGLKNIIPNIDNIENEFLFIFGDKEIRMSKINAEFISPLISKLHRSDPTINTYKYATNEHMKKLFTKTILKKIELLCKGESIEIDYEENKKLERISILLCNDELQKKLLELYPVNYSEENIKQIILDLSIEAQIGFTHQMNEKNIEFVSSNFFKLDDKELEELSKLPKSVLYCILSNPKLKLLNEDSLFDFIQNLFKDEDLNLEKGNEIIEEFYEMIEIEHLSYDKFIELISILNENNITHSIWNKLRQLLVLHFESFFNKQNKSPRYAQDKKEKQQEGQTFEYNGEESGAFKGIIAHLTEKFGGNVHTKNIVNVTSSSVNRNHLDRVASIVVDLEDKQHYFQSSNESDTWLKYDFKDRKVRPTFYSIRTRHDNGKGCNHPKNWVIEGSNTGRDDDWKILDTRSGITVLDDMNKIHTFDIKERLESNEFYKFLRIRQTDKNTGNTNFLIFSSLEYFGTII